MSAVPLRPHHALCIRFFEGKGYSESFVRHMAEVIDMLSDGDPVIALSDGCDVICEECPHKLSGVCDNEEKVKAIDDGALKAMGLSAGREVRWSELYKNAYDMIVEPGRLREVCRGCMWLNICDR